MKKNHSLIWLRKNREFLNMRAIGKAIGYNSPSPMSMLINDTPRKDGSRFKMTAEKETKLNHLIKSLKK